MIGAIFKSDDIVGKHCESEMRKRSSGSGFARSRRADQGDGLAADGDGAGVQTNTPRRRSTNPITGPTR